MSRLPRVKVYHALPVLCNALQCFAVFCSAVQCSAVANQIGLSGSVGLKGFSVLLSIDFHGKKTSKCN